MVGRFRSVGIDEFVLYWPRHRRQEATHEDVVFEAVARETIPKVRASG